MFNERAVRFESSGRQLSGVLHGADSASIGVLIVVGGPQYRVGSHRQFVHLARDLAGRDIPVMRFDVTGMGDSEGDKKTFDQLDDDIAAALDCFCAEAGLERVVLWGLCDGASAALIYGPQDKRVSGLILTNPWLENTQAKAKTDLLDYYLRRLFSRGFWSKLLSGKVKLADSAKDLGGTVKAAVETEQPSVCGEQYQQRMLDAYQRLPVPVCWILSGEDLTAGEFERQLQGDKQWRKVARRRDDRIERLAEADHTFSTRSWKLQVGRLSADFVGGL
ncbi:hydrolase 1, exosortase A system-associated [Motiliproteus sp.]|uniref:hydrolase 1, exosortase A system-associated n=1 Tax=Motiliproteus sp. TaxID=1898955 RepID=UPI003BAA5E5F